MRRSGARWRGGLGGIGLGVLALLPGLGCGPAAVLLMTAAGGAAAITGEPQRMYNTQGQDFDEQRIGQIRSGVHTPEDFDSGKARCRRFDTPSARCSS